MQVSRHGDIANWRIASRCHVAQVRESSPVRHIIATRCGDGFAEPREPFERVRATALIA